MTLSRLPSGPFLYVITDPALGRDSSQRLVARVASTGVGVVQLRAKGLSDAMLMRAAKASAEAAHGAGALLIINDRADVALIAGADGVHVGDDDVSVEDLRRLPGRRLVIGRSSHSIDAALRAAEEDVDYVAIGPVFDSQTKQVHRALGLEAVDAVKRRGIGCPLIAIGGITPARIREVVEAGADGIAVIGAAMSGEVESSCRRLLQSVAAADMKG